MVTKIDSHAAWKPSPSLPPADRELAEDSARNLSFFAAVPIILVFFLLLSARPTTILIASGICLAIIAVFLTRRLVLSFRGSTPPESQSLMNFAHLGTLTCICEESAPHISGQTERRLSCRTCGHLIEMKDLSRLDLALSRMEISGIAAKLRSAAIESQGMELPLNLENIDELVDYLRDSPPPPPPPSDPPSLVPSRRFA